MKDGDQPTGPRGGTTTVSKTGKLIRKTFWLHHDEEEALRNAAHERRKSEAELVREALRQYFGIED